MYTKKSATQTVVAVSLPTFILAIGQTCFCRLEKKNAIKDEILQKIESLSLRLASFLQEKIPKISHNRFKLINLNRFHNMQGHHYELLQN